MEVPNPEAFVKDPNVTAAVASGIADALNLPSSWVTVVLSVVSAGGAAAPTPAPTPAGNERRLAAGEVQVDYTITIPGEVTAASGNSASVATSPAGVTAALGSADPAAFTTKINNAITSSLGASAASQFTVQVQSITFGTTTTTTTTTPAPPRSRAVIQEDDDEDTAKTVGIIVGVFAALFVITLCCLYAVFCTGLFFKKKEEELPGRLQVVQPVSGADLLGGEGQALNVVPNGDPPPRWAEPRAEPQLSDRQGQDINVQDIAAPPGVVVHAE
jgi:hypothetical protein